MKQIRLSGLMLLLSQAVLFGSVPEDNRRTMSLDDVVAIAREQSVPALSAKASFVSSYWAYRTYEASRLPSLTLMADLMSFDRSLRQLQNFETGELGYVTNYNMQNNMSLSLSQNVALTGGSISMTSSLSRTDQFGENPYATWFSRPLTFSYRQPLFGYNSFKWEKLISPKEYEKAKRVYIEAMEQVTGTVAKFYFALMLAKRNHDKASTNYDNTRRMLSIAAERMTLGSVTRDEYLQLELRMLNDSIAINETSIVVKEAQMNLNSILGYDESFEIDPVLDENLPDVQMDYEMVLGKAYENSSFVLDNEIKTLSAESSLAQAKANRGISVSFNADFGLTNTDRTLPGTYRNLLDQEGFGISFTIPILDWGQGQGRVKKAKAAAEVTRASVEQAENDFRRNVFTSVGQFNNQKNQCSVSRRAAIIASERYGLMMEKFRNGGASVMELNTAQNENDDATDNYIMDIYNFWDYYYTIRKITLYDFIEGKDIDVDYNELLK